MKISSLFKFIGIKSLSIIIFSLCALWLSGNQGNLGYLEKSGLRFSMKAFFPSFASSDK